MNDQWEDYTDPKRTPKRNLPNNYRLIISLTMMRKILTAHIREEIYGSLINRGLFPEE